MSQKIENAKQALTEQCRQFLLNNRDGSLGKFNVRELTAQCGMATGTFYHYFKNKDELVVQILGSDWDDIIADIKPVSELDIPLYYKVRAVYEKIADFEQRYYYSAMSLMNPSPENMKSRKQSEEKMHEAIKAFLSEEEKRGELFLTASLDSAAYLLIQLFIATARNPDMDFDELWNCMNFIDASQKQ